VGIPSGFFLKPIKTIQKRKMNQTKELLTEKRIEIQEIKSGAGKLGPVTSSVTPEDVEVMFAGKMCDIMIRNKVRVSNLKDGYLRSWDIITPEIEASIEEQFALFSKDFESAKKRVTKIAENHPLWQRLGGIKGFSAYQMALVMSHIKDVGRFDTPSRLCVYAGVSEIKGMAITKANLNKIKKHYADQGKEFKGFNTEFSGRMFVIVDCLMRSRGYFYHMYKGIRERLVKRIANQQESEMKGNKALMKGKKNQSVELFTDKNAKRRVARTLLHLFWTEWRTMNNLPVRVPYPVDYLGHSSVITLDEVLAYDSNTNTKK
jgi:hypothetical protein